MPPPQIDSADYHRLAEIGVLDKVELDRGVIVTGWDKDRAEPFAVCFTPAQARAAAAHGVRVYSAVDAVLDEPAALAELDARRHAS